MPQFALPDWTSARLVSVTPRQECHGDEHVVALTMRFRVSGHNEMLDQFDATLRRALFAGKDELQGIRSLPGVDEPTPHLRHRVLEGIRHSLPLKTEGATVLVDYGIDGDKKPITLGDSKADKVSAAGYDGGSFDLEFNVGTSDIDGEELGIICSQLGSEFPIKVIAPKEQPKAATTDAASDPKQPTLDGTTGNSVGEASPARQAADAAFKGEPERGSDWPFPRGFETPGPDDTDSEGGDTDATSAVLADVDVNGAGHTGAPITYQDPDKPSRTWIGRGRMPTWLKSALAMGKTLADFEVRAH